jgi:hypothetical protein
MKRSRRFLVVVVMLASSIFGPLAGSAMAEEEEGWPCHKVRIVEGDEWPWHYNVEVGADAPCLLRLIECLTDPVYGGYRCLPPLDPDA